MKVRVERASRRQPRRTGSAFACMLGLAWIGGCSRSKLDQIGNPICCHNSSLLLMIESFGNRSPCIVLSVLLPNILDIFPNYGFISLTTLTRRNPSIQTQTYSSSPTTPSRPILNFRNPTRFPTRIPFDPASHRYPETVPCLIALRTHLSILSSCLD